MEAGGVDKQRRLSPPTYTQIPNELLDEFMVETTSMGELKIVLAIARKTFGWGEKERLLSLTQLQQLTGLSRAAAQKGIESAMGRGVLSRRRVGHGFFYGIPIASASNVGSSGLERVQDVNQQRVQDADSAHIQGKKPTSKEKQQGTDNRLDSVVEEIFEAWRVGTNRNGASKLDTRRRVKIEARLRESAKGADGEDKLGFARAEVLEAVAGMVGSEWHRANAQQEFDQLFRNRERIETFVARHRKDGAALNGNAEYDTTRRNPELED